MCADAESAMHCDESIIPLRISKSSGKREDWKDLQYVMRLLSLITLVMDRNFR